MGLRTYMDKHPKSGVYRYRKTVPPELRDFLPHPYTGKRELVKSLETKDPKEAARLHSIIQEQMEQVLDAARIAHALANSQTPDGSQPLGDQDLAVVMPEYAATLARITAAKDDFFVKPPSVPLALSTWGNMRVEPIPEPTSTAASADKARNTIQQVFDAYIREKRPSMKTEHEFRRSWMMFLDSAELSMESDIKAVAKAQIRRFKEGLLRYPQRKADILTQSDKRPVAQRTFQEIVDASSALGLKPIADKTIQKHIAALSSVLNYSAINDYRLDNPAEGLNIKIDKSERRRLPYDASDLMKIFDSRVFSEDRWGHRQWLPILALYTGCRLEEIGQLLVEDLKRDGDQWYLAIREADDAGNVVKRVKTASSERNVPLHPEVIRLGFLDYVSTKREQGAAKIFGDMPGPVANRSTHYFSRWWGLQRKAFKITDGKKTFHSFRHTFKDACRNAGIPEDVSDALTGHAHNSVGRSYGVGHSLPVLAEWISRISYPITIR